MTADELLLASRERRSVIAKDRTFPVWAKKPRPAAWVVSMRFLDVARSLKSLEVYNVKSGKELAK